MNKLIKKIITSPLAGVVIIASQTALAGGVYVIDSEMLNPNQNYSRDVNHYPRYHGTLGNNPLYP